MSKTLTAPNSQHFASATPSSSIYNEQATNKLLDTLISIPDPDEVLTRAGLSRCELRKLDGDDEITTAADTRCEAVIATPWHFEGGDGKPATGKEVDIIVEMAKPWIETMMLTAWQAVPYGYSVWETVYKREGARIEIDWLEEKPFNWFIPARRGVLKYKTLEQPLGVVVDTRFKFFLTVRRPTYRMPQGQALYSRLYWPWFFRKMGWQFWMKHLERWGIPFLLGHTQGNATTMAKELAKMVQNATGAVGMNDKVEALQVTGTAHFEAFERAVTARVQKVLLGQTLTTDVGGSSGKSGSFAAAKVHNEVRQDRRNADLRLVRATVQRQIEALWVLNRFQGPAPIFCLEDDTGLQADRAERDSKLVQSKAVRLTKEYFLRTYDFEEGDIEIPDPQEASEAGAGEEEQKGGKKGELKAARGERRFTAGQQVIEDLVANAGTHATSPIDPELIRNAIKAAKDPDDLIDRLAVLFADREPWEFERILERCIFAGSVLGFAHAQPGEPPKKAEQPAPERLAIDLTVTTKEAPSTVTMEKVDGRWVVRKESVDAAGPQ